MTNGGPDGASQSVDPLCLPDRDRAVPAGLRLGRLDAAVRADPGAHHPAAAGAAGAAAWLSARISRHRLAWRDMPLWLGGMALAVAWGAPFVWMVSTSLKPAGAGDDQARSSGCRARSTFANYAKVFEYPIADLGHEQLDPGRRHDRAVRAVRRHGRLRAGPAALSRPRSAVPAVPRSTDGSGRGHRRAAAPGLHQDRLGLVPIRR